MSSNVYTSSEILSALSLAVRMNRLEEVQKLLTANKDIPINDKPSIGRPVLIEATFRQNFEIIKLLLEYGASPNVQETKYGFTPLHIAADIKNGNREFLPLYKDKGQINEIIQLLVSKGASFDIMSKSAWEINPEQPEFFSSIHNSDSFDQLTPRMQFTQQELLKIDINYREENFLTVLKVFKDIRNPYEYATDTLKLSLVTLPVEILAKIGSYAIYNFDNNNWTADEINYDLGNNGNNIADTTTTEITTSENIAQQSHNIDNWTVDEMIARFEDITGWSQEEAQEPEQITNCDHTSLYHHIEDTSITVETAHDTNIGLSGSINCCVIL